MTLKKSKLASDAFGNAIQGALHPTTTTVIAFTDTAAKNNTAIVAEVVRITSEQDCYLKFGDSGVVATTSNMPMKAGQPEYFTMDGDTYISAIRVSVSGNLFVTIMI